MKLNAKKADTMVRIATEGKYKNVASLPQQDNEYIKGIDNKLRQMSVVETFRDDLEAFVSVHVRRNISAGALLQTVSIGLGQGEDDNPDNWVGTDFLPSPAASLQYKTYTKTFVTDFSRRYEVNYSNDIFDRAFTDNGYTSIYLSQYISRGPMTYKLELYNYFFERLHVSVRNVKDLGNFTYTTNADKAAALRDIFDVISEDIAINVPYSDEFNLGLATTETTFPQNTANDGTRNVSGMDYGDLPGKKNTLTMNVIDGVPKFELFLLIPAVTYAAYNTKVLGDIYNSGYNALERKFEKIIPVAKTVTNPVTTTTANFYVAETNAGLLTETIDVIVYDREAAILGKNINVGTSQLWAKGKGGYLTMNVLHTWNTFCILPFANGRKYTFKLVQQAAPTNVVEI